MTWRYRRSDIVRIDERNAEIMLLTNLCWRGADSVGRCLVAVCRTHGVIGWFEERLGVSDVRAYND